jgi:hypothetical protein
LVVALLVAAVGCASPTGSPTASSDADSSSASGTPSAAAGVSIHILGDGPVLTGTDVDDDWLLPGALTVVDGTYHLWGVAFAQETEESHGYYATSLDGMSWTVHPDDPLASFGIDLSYPGPLPGSVLREADGRWVMYAWGTPAPMLRGSVLYRATAAAPEGPWTAVSEPILAGTDDAWDDSYVDFPSVIANDDGYLMLYSGGSFMVPGRSAIGLATSADGFTWTKLPDPVLEPGLCGEFDSRSVAIPRFRVVAEELLVLYVGLTRDTSAPSVVGAALSPDGQSWTCASPVPAMTDADLPDSQGIHSFAVAATAAGPEVLAESLGDVSSSLWFGDIDLSALD